MNDEQNRTNAESNPTRSENSSETKAQWVTPDFTEASVAVATHAAYNSSGSDGTFFS